MTDKREMSSYPPAAQAPYPAAPPATGYSSGAPPVYTTQQPPDNGGQYNAGYQSQPYSAPCTLYNGQEPPQVNYSPGAPPQQTIIVRQPQMPFVDHTNTALVVTFCCCLPFGIVGLLKMSEAKNLLATGNNDAAIAAATSAGKWTKAGLIFGILLYLFLVAFTVIWIVVVASLGYDY